MIYSRKPLFTYSLAIVATALAAGATLLLEPLTLGIPFLLFFGAVMVSARFGGIGPGLLSVALSSLFADYFVLLPVHKFAPRSGLDLVRLSLFILVATLIVVLNESLRRVQHHTENVLLSIADGFCSVDEKGILTYINPEACAIAQLTPCSRRLKIQALFPPGRFPGFYDEYSRAISTRQVVSFEDHDQHSQQWLEFRLYPSDEGFSIYFRDISDRKRAAQALEDSEIRFRTVAETACDAILLIDAASTLLFVNHATEQIFGYLPDELVGKNLTLLMPDYMRLLHEAGMKRYLDTGKRHLHWESIELPGLHKSGHEVPLEVSFGEFTRDGAVFFTGFARDISERKRVQDSLRESEERFSATIHQAAVGIAQLSVDGTFLLVNDRLCEILGYSREDLHKITYQQIAFAGDLEENFAFDDRLLRGEIEQYSLDTRRVRGDGSIVWVNLTKSLVRDAARLPKYAIVIFQDINLRKQAQQALQESEENFRRAQQAANIGSYVWDLNTNHVTWNAECPSLSQVAPDANFNTWMKHVHPEDLPLVFGAIEAMKDGGEHFSEARVNKPDGSVVWIYSGGKFLFNSQGQPTHAVGIAMDITARKLAEDRLRSTEKLAAAGRLAATIAHEINNPLESITNLHFLLRAEESLSPGARRFLELAELEVERVAHIARQTLGFYRGNSAVSAVNLPEVLDDVLSLYRNKLENRQIRVNRHYECKREIQGMKGEIRQVFSNLISNALDAMNPGGHLTVSTKLPRNNSVAGVQIGIEDNGEGISEENLQRIFEAFFTTKKDVGTGLGLWVSKGIVESQGGVIEVQSNTAPENHGTCFSVILPFEAPNPDHTNADAAVKSAVPSQL